MGETDEELMAAFQSGSEEAFKTLFDRCAVRLFNFSLRFFKSNEEAEDVAQEVLLRVFHKKERRLVRVEDFTSHSLKKAPGCITT
jgi:RNA polymerase sigma-70 factor (ECF subfamily)